MTRANLRSIRDDAQLRDEAIRRVLSPSCVTRCYVRTSFDGSIDHNCDCASGFQYASDEEKEALESCPARDTWSDFKSLIMAHGARGAGPNDPIVCDCDCLTPIALAVAAWIAWYAPRGLQVAGRDLGAHRHDASRFAVAITLPKGADIAHAYALTTSRPPHPQPEIRMGEWYVWDPAAHWGMDRPRDTYYANGEVVAYELLAKDIDGLNMAT